MKFFEAHITVHPKTDIETLKNFCMKNSFKLIDIRLNKGSHKRQLMITCQFKQAKDHTAIYDFSEAVIKIQKAGFKILRKKLEASEMLGHSVYFEAHWKMTFEDGKERLKHQKKLAEIEDIRVSFNGDDSESNLLYLTVRDKDMDNFHLLCERKDDELRKTYSKIKFHNERVLIDSNIALDNGWF